MNCATTNAFLLMIDDHSLLDFGVPIEASVQEARELRDYKRIFANDRRSFRNGIT